MHWGEYIKTEDKRPLSVYLRWRDKQVKHIVLSSGSQYLLLSLCWVFSRDSYFWDRQKWFPEVVVGDGIQRVFSLLEKLKSDTEMPENRRQRIPLIASFDHRNRTPKTMSRNVTESVDEIHEINFTSLFFYSHAYGNGFPFKWHWLVISKYTGFLATYYL